MITTGESQTYPCDQHLVCGHYGLISCYLGFLQLVEVVIVEKNLLMSQILKCAMSLK